MQPFWALAHCHLDSVSSRTAALINPGKVHSTEPGNKLHFCPRSIIRANDGAPTRWEVMGKEVQACLKGEDTPSPYDLSHPLSQGGDGFCDLHWLPWSRVWTPGLHPCTA